MNLGDKVVLYTDGMTEARNFQEEMYSLERFTESVQKHGHKPCQELITSLRDEVFRFIGKREQYDDITLVVMEAV
ncbi:MAG: SpoIIE family protein phosphatase [Elusimicrobia bacterium]|nr:SpoIIE family protein phosphatase [Elusimicrobiota bacterium]